ncbi:glycosyltransferase family 2 protein (plasmid) [Flammeovirgaceae bacterium SG7u.111]|nr:glycosyltransferase family 2 protein [Flammeovirgaceae bacterium SG7u.132]WPO38810.1 glycosyltransferase family 2 protein [Flammeovirgaceae bacterium SG7u.111]
MLLEIVFWCCLFIVTYNYIGYSFITYFFILLKKKPSPSISIADADLPEVTLIIPAYNEERFIEKKAQNTLALSYPKDKLQIIFITDGSTDNTQQIIKKYPQFILLHSDKRAGKSAAVNRAMQHVKTPVAIFCDANTLLNEHAIVEISKHYANPEIGGVSGEKKVIAESEDGAAGSEGIYWKYESMLKKLDSKLYSIVGAAGELFSVRTDLYEPIEEDTILDDFMISLRINLKGYRVIYEPKAYAMETPSSSIKDEQKRKVRICAGGFQSMSRLLPLLNFFKHPALTFLYISHRVLRWTLSPLSLLVLFLICPFLWKAGIVYQAIIIAQLGFYASSLLGWILAKKNIKVKLLYIPYYFTFMNLSVFAGFFKFIRGKQSAVWVRSDRKQLSTP